MSDTDEPWRAFTVDYDEHGRPMVITGEAGEDCFAAFRRHHNRIAARALREAARRMEARRDRLRVDCDERLIWLLDAEIAELRDRANELDPAGYPKPDEGLMG